MIINIIIQSIFHHSSHILINNYIFLNDDDIFKYTLNMLTYRTWITTAYCTTNICTAIFKDIIELFLKSSVSFV